nr:MAG TPA: hypothetical protein [Caudoviricetes sp.]DAV51717.1 MAG TPA: hypothetical protein [Bacteriophage sp.]
MLNLHLAMQKAFASLQANHLHYLLVFAVQGQCPQTRRLQKLHHQNFPYSYSFFS